MSNKKTQKTWDRARLWAIFILSLCVIVTGILFSSQALSQGNVSGSILGAMIALIILVFALIVYKRGNEDLKNGTPIQDERSRRVIEKASSRAFYVSLYLLLAVGFVSDEIIKFRDVSQATGLTIGSMALLFLFFWIYYNKREI